MLCAPMSICTSGSSALLGRPRCGLSICLSLLAIFNTLFRVYADFFPRENGQKQILEVRLFQKGSPFQWKDFVSIAPHFLLIEWYLQAGAWLLSVEGPLLSRGVTFGKRVGVTVKGGGGFFWNSMVSWVHTSRMNLQDKRRFKLCIFKCLCYIEKNHLIGFSDLVDLWVIKIKKPMILCACSTSRSSEQSTKNTDHTVRVCERFVYSVVKITRLYDYQTWKTRFWRNSRGAQRFVGFVFLTVLYGCWLAEQTNSDDRMFSLQFWLILSSADMFSHSSETFCISDTSHQPWFNITLPSLMKPRQSSSWRQHMLSLELNVQTH